MNRDFEAELMTAFNAFGLLIQRALPITVNVSAIVDKAPTISEGCNKLNQLIGDQAGMIPDSARLMMENWVDTFYAASVVSALAENHPDAVERQAALSAYTHLMAQGQALFAILVDWHIDGRDDPLSE